MLENIEFKVKKVLTKILYHNLSEVQHIFENTFLIKFPDISKLMKAIHIRHSMVHRNGKDKDENIIPLSKNEVKELIDDVKDFVLQVENQFD